jgi:ribonucleoside-diphosphate reductase alpha chain
MVKTIQYLPSKTALGVLIKGNIIAPGESPQHMFERVVDTLFSVEPHLRIPKKETEKAKEEFARYMAAKMYTPGTPTLTNAGRPGYEHAALSSCAIIPVNLRNKRAASEQIKAYYRQNMGSGFNLTPYSDAVGLLLWLNDLAANETKTGKYDRYIGNMANLHVSHPQIQEFIALKRTHALPHFNCSVVVDDRFMHKALRRKTKEHGILMDIAESAWNIGDPSIINLGRMNRDNPVADIAPYTSAPPCAEMGLSVGETCQFVYVNISKFCKPRGIDYPLLEKAIRVVTRALDNAVEYGSSRYPDPESVKMALLKRKIGIAVSGIADTLLYYDIPYDSDKARTLVRDVVSYMNYVSKCASVELARERGSCGAMKFKDKNKYYAGYLEKRYHFSTNTVKASDWKKLSNTIVKTGYLRNIHTLTQPPAARVSLLMDASFGIEPIFGVPNSISAVSLPIRTYVEKFAKNQTEEILVQACRDGSFQKTKLPSHAKERLKTATEIPPSTHITMTAALVGTDGVIDETASKTVNLSQKSSIEDVFDTFLLAHQKGLKNISIYRDGSYKNQPYNLSK